MEMFEKVENTRERAYEVAGLDDELDFWTAAIDLGYSERDADEITVTLNLRTMRARGAI